jgi:WS/DGAT/MGAT family acyltransferase
MAKKVITDFLQDAIETSAEQISGQDATFLYADTASSPMHIATLTIVENSLKFNDFREVLESKLHLIPKFRKKLVNVPLNLDYPYWADDPNFDLDLHLNRLKLPDPANWKTLRDLTSNIFSSSLDLKRPLWSVYFIEGLDEIAQVPKGSVAILTKVHHVMIDGSSGVGIMGMLFDKENEVATKKPKKQKPFDPEPLPDEFSLLLKSTYGFIKNPFKLPKFVGETAVSMLKGKFAAKLKTKKAFQKNTFPVPKTIFNNSISPKRTWGTAILSFDRINTLRKIMDVSINDIILAICAGGIRKYLEEREQLPVQPLVANVPISIRVKSEKQQMNNKISNMLVRIATHIKDPLKRLEYIQEQTNLGKTKHKAVGAKSLSQMANAVPFGLANLAAGLYSKYNIKEFHRPPFNVTITNVPGPKGLLYINGHKIVGIFGLTPVLDGFGLIIAAFSYNGQVTITTTSDAKTMPDADKFSRYIRESANELEEIILKKKDEKIAPKTLKFKSVSFFNSLKKHITDNKSIDKKLNAIYNFEVHLEDKIENWTLDFSKKAPSISKRKSAKTTNRISINDTVLYDLFKGKLLLEEVQIQERITLEGTKKDTDLLLKLIATFLENL